MVSGISAYRFVPVDPVRKMVPVRRAGITRSDNSRIARRARYDAIRMQTYAPYRSARNRIGSGKRVSSAKKSKYFVRRRLDTYA